MQSKFYIKIHVIKHDMDPNTSRKTPPLKSVHFKKSVTQSSFLSKSVVIFVIVILKMTTLFERNEDRVTGFLKWTDFTKQSMEDVLIEFSGFSSTIMSVVSFSQGAQASFYMLSSLVIIDADCPLRFRTYCKWKQAKKPGI